MASPVALGSLIHVAGGCQVPGSPLCPTGYRAAWPSEGGPGGCVRPGLSWLCLGMESSQPQAAEAQCAWDGFPSCPDRVPSLEGRSDASGREEGGGNSAPLCLPAGSPPGETLQRALTDG